MRSGDDPPCAPSKQSQIRLFLGKQERGLPTVCDFWARQAMPKRPIAVCSAAAKHHRLGHRSLPSGRAARWPVGRKRDRKHGRFCAGSTSNSRCIRWRNRRSRSCAQLDKDAQLDAQEHLERAKNLLSGRRWIEAAAELQGLPPDLGPTLRDEVDYWLGTTFFACVATMAGSAASLAVAKGSKAIAADAMFHGRGHCHAPIATTKPSSATAICWSVHPHSKYSAEASFLIGWLDYNRSRYEQAITSLDETLKRYSSGTYAEEARWYIGWSRYLFGDFAGRCRRFLRCRKRADSAAAKAFTGWPSQLRLGKQQEGLSLCASSQSGSCFSHYGQLSWVRLADAGQNIPLFIDPVRQSPDGLPGVSAPAGQTGAR